MVRGDIYENNAIWMKFNPFILEIKPSILEFYEELTNTPDLTIDKLITSATDT